MDKLSNLLNQLNKRWHNSDEKRKVFVFSDGFNHYWTKLCRFKDLTDEEKKFLV